MSATIARRGGPTKPQHKRQHLSESGLSAREREIPRSPHDGRRFPVQRRWSDKLFISRQPLRNHVHRIYEAARAERTEALNRAFSESDGYHGPCVGA